MDMVRQRPELGRTRWQARSANLFERAPTEATLKLRARSAKLALLSAQCCADSTLFKGGSTELEAAMITMMTSAFGPIMRRFQPRWTSAWTKVWWLRLNSRPHCGAVGLSWPRESASEGTKSEECSPELAKAGANSRPVVADSGSSIPPK